MNTDPVTAGDEIPQKFRHHFLQFFTWLVVTIKLSIQINGLVQDCSNSSALALELLQSCTKPSMIVTDHLVSLQINFHELKIKFC